MDIETEITENNANRTLRSGRTRNTVTDGQLGQTRVFENPMKLKEGPRIIRKRTATSTNNFATKKAADAVDCTTTVDIDSIDPQESVNCIEYDPPEDAQIHVPTRNAPIVIIPRNIVVDTSGEEVIAQHEAPSSSATPASAGNNGGQPDNPAFPDYQIVRRECRIKNLTRERSDMKKENAKLAKRVTSLEKQIKNKDTLIEDLKDKNKKLRQMVTELKKKTGKGSNSEMMETSVHNLDASTENMVDYPDQSSDCVVLV